MSQKPSFGIYKNQKLLNGTEINLPSYTRCLYVGEIAQGLKMHVHLVPNINTPLVFNNFEQSRKLSPDVTRKLLQIKFGIADIIIYF